MEASWHIFWVLGLGYTISLSFGEHQWKEETQWEPECTPGQEASTPVTLHSRWQWHTLCHYWGEQQTEQEWRVPLATQDASLSWETSFCVQVLPKQQDVSRPSESACYHPIHPFPLTISLTSYYQYFYFGEGDKQNLEVSQPKQNSTARHKIWVFLDG